MTTSVQNPTGGVSDSGLAGRSRGALLRRFSDLGPVLAAPMVARAIPADGVSVDMEMAGGRFYGGDGRVITARQVADFLADPVRFLPEIPRAGGEGSAVERRMLDFLYRESRRLGLDEAGLSRVPPALDCGFLIVLGIGLGHHLPQLVASTGARHVIILETETEFLRQSTAAIDWQALFEAVEGRGGRIHLFLANAAAPFAIALNRIFETAGLPFLDGSILYQHYNNPVLTEIGQRVAEVARLAFAARSHYENERIAMTNASANLAAARFHLLDNRPKPARVEPALIVASGPSLDASIEHVKRLREGAILFSCGSALRVLRHHGIIPDYHCENEATPQVGELLSEVDRSFGLQGITLVASATVDPRVPAKFAETYFYFREGAISSRVLATAGQELQYAAPTASNMGLRAAVALGFKTVYLFGVDCGSRFSDRIHARASACQQFGNLREEDRARRFDQQVPGNFGGTVASDASLNWARSMLGVLVARSGIKVINCSNGAMIEGAPPRHGADLSFAVPRFDRPRVRREIAAAHPIYGPGDLLRARSFTQARQETRGTFDDLAAAIVSAGPDCHEFFPVWRRLAPFLEDRPAGSGGLSAMALGPARAMAKLATFFLNRMPEPESRRQLLTGFLGEYREILLVIRDDTLELLDQLAIRHPPTPPPPPSAPPP